MMKVKILYQLLCIVATLGMTTLCILKYLKNESVVSVHDSPTDVYPSITLCFEGKKTGPFVDTNNVEKVKISDMMKGLTKLNRSLLENATYDDMTIMLNVDKIDYVMLENDLKLKTQCTQSDCFKTIGDVRIKCFTHDINIEGQSTLMSMWIKLDNAKSTLADFSMSIYLHHPGQFFRNSLKAVLVSKYSAKDRSQMNFNIESLTVLRKREDDKTGCNPGSSEDDEMILKKTAKMFSCKSKYPG